MKLFFPVEKKKCQSGGLQTRIFDLTLKSNVLDLKPGMSIYFAQLKNLILRSDYSLTIDKTT